MSHAGASLATSQTLLLCGGGTGGHVYPALAVASALRARALARGAKQQLVYVGNATGMEAELVKRESDLPFRAIPSAAVLGRGPLELVKSSWTIGRGVLAAQQLLNELRPAAILGTGGYVCVPLFLAARLRRVPTMVYLPDVVPGLAVRTIAKLTNVVGCNVADALGHFRPRAGVRYVVTGYPVRAELFTQQRADCQAAFELDPQVPTLLVYGGSRGARSINQAIAALLPALLAQAQIIHVCGREGDAAFLRHALERVPPADQRRYNLYEYLHAAGNGPTMTAAFGAADVAICRSGASTMAELPAAGLPAVLIPLPIPGVHQAENAHYLARHGAAVVVADETMIDPAQPTSGALFQAIHRLLVQPEERRRMAERSRALARPDAADQLAAVLAELAEGDKR